METMRKTPLPQRRRHVAGIATIAVTALATALLTATPATAAVQATIYVAPTGSDSAAGTIGDPLATLAGAKAAVATMNSSMTGDIDVVFRGGTYPVTSTVAFGSSDSGTNGHTVNYRAYSGEIPVFDGGDHIPGSAWSPYSGNVWVADYSRSTKLRTLYVNGERATLARSSGTQATVGGFGTHAVTANGTWALDSGSTFAGVTLNASGLPGSYARAGDMEIVNQSGFSFHVVGVDSIAASGGNQNVTLQQPMGSIALTTPVPWGSPFLNTADLSQNHFYLQNAFELLDQPGEFYFDRTAGKLYYHKPASVTLSTADVVAPRAEQVVTIAGTSTTDRAHDISFSGLTFTNTHWSLIDVQGSVGATTVQSNALYSRFWSSGDWHSAQSGGTSGYANTTMMPSAVRVDNAQRIAFSGNTFTHLGSGAVTYGNDVVDSSVTGSVFRDISGAAITVGDPRHTYVGDGDMPAGVEGVPTNVLIKNNSIDRVAAEFLQTVPITAYYATGLTIDHNEVTNAPYTGISVGWGFNSYYANATPATRSTSSSDNTISNNIIAGTMTKLHDGGAIYTVGAQPNSTVLDNLIENTGGASYGNPIYTDQSSSGFTIAGNVVDKYNGTWWYVWGTYAYVSGVTVDANTVNTAGLTEATLLTAGLTATTSTLTNSYTGWTSRAQSTVQTAGLEPAYRPLRAANSGIFTRGTVEGESGVRGGRAIISPDSAASGGQVVAQLDLVGDNVSYPNIGWADTVTIRYAAPHNGTIGVYVNGVRKASLSFGSTGAWFGSYGTASVKVPINGGDVVMLKNDPGDKGLNLDTITFTATPTPNVEPETAGSFVGRGYACTVGPTMFNGAGVCQLDLVGDGVSVTSPIAASSFSLRYASPNAGALSVYVNGAKVGRVFFSSTGGWFSGWARVSFGTPIPSGATVLLKNDPGDAGLNLDSIRFTP